MKLTIDTKEESKEEIKKIIQFLQKIVEEEYSSYNKPPSTSTQGSFNMFGSDNTQNKDSFNSPPSSMDMFGSDTTTNSNTFTENSSSDIYAEKKELEKEETFNVHDMLEEY